MDTRSGRFHCLRVTHDFADTCAGWHLRGSGPAPVAGAEGLLRARRCAEQAPSPSAPFDPHTICVDWSVRMWLCRQNLRRVQNNPAGILLTTAPLLLPEPGPGPTAVLRAATSQGLWSLISETSFCLLCSGPSRSVAPSYAQMTAVTSLLGDMLPLFTRPLLVCFSLAESHHRFTLILW